MKTRYLDHISGLVDRFHGNSAEALRSCQKQLAPSTVTGVPFITGVQRAIGLDINMLKALCKFDDERIPLFFRGSSFFDLLRHIEAIYRESFLPPSMPVQEEDHILRGNVVVPDHIKLVFTAFTQLKRRTPSLPLVSVLEVLLSAELHMAYGDVLSDNAPQIFLRERWVVVFQNGEQFRAWEPSVEEVSAVSEML